MGDSRPLKFRVWDKINKEWLIYKDCNVGWLLGMTGQKTLADDPPRPNIMKMYCSPDGSTFNDLQFCIDSDDFEVVQYTGRKDKNVLRYMRGIYWIGKAVGPLKLFGAKIRLWFNFQ